jgi:hypothetical protein
LLYRLVLWTNKTKQNFMAISLQANYTDKETAAADETSADSWWYRVLRGQRN